MSVFAALMGSGAVAAKAGSQEFWTEPVIHWSGWHCPKMKWGLARGHIPVPLEIPTNERHKVTCPTCKAEIELKKHVVDCMPKVRYIKPASREYKREHARQTGKNLAEYIMG